MNTVLAVADPHPAHQRFLAGDGARLAPHGWQLRTVPYSHLHDVPTDGVRAAVLFFPHVGWAEEVESLPAALYGSVAHGKALRELIVRAGTVLRRRLPGVAFLNSPEAVALTRDKGAVKHRWTATGVPTPGAVRAGTAAELAAAVAERGSVYVKAPCGSMNKGITVLTPQRRRSNFVFDHGVLRAPRPGDPQYLGPDAWAFADVDPADDGFLAALCAEPGFVMEQGLADGVVDGARVEARVTVIGGRVLDVAVAGAPAGAPTTQRRSGPAGTPMLPADVLEQIEQLAVRATAALDLGYSVLDVVLDADLAPMVIDAQAFPATGTPPEIFAAMLGQVTAAAAATAAPTAAPSDRRAVHAD